MVYIYSPHVLYVCVECTFTYVYAYVLTCICVNTFKIPSALEVANMPKFFFFKDLVTYLKGRERVREGEIEIEKKGRERSPI